MTLLSSFYGNCEIAFNVDLTQRQNGGVNKNVHITLALSTYTSSLSEMIVQWEYILMYNFCRTRRLFIMDNSYVSNS